jgi:hypothetical protein
MKFILMLDINNTLVDLKYQILEEIWNFAVIKWKFARVSEFYHLQLFRNTLVCAMETSFLNKYLQNLYWQQEDFLKAGASVSHWHFFYLYWFTALV